MFCFTRSKKWGKVIPLLRNGVHWWVSLLKLASFQVRLRSPMLTHLVIALRHAHRCWLQQWVDERMRVPTPCNFFMLEKQTILTKRPLANLQVASSTRGKRESCDPWCPCYFWKTTPWMTYNFEIMKKVVTLQNGIGLWSRKLVLKPKAFL